MNRENFALKLVDEITLYYSLYVLKNILGNVLFMLLFPIIQRIICQCRVG